MCEPSQDIPWDKMSLSILDKLEDKFVVSFTLELDKSILSVVTECDCENYLDLDKRQVEKLIQELRTLHGSMVNETNINEKHKEE